MLRVFRHVRELIALIGGREDAIVRRRTAQLEAQLAKLKADRAAREAAIEAEALQGLRAVVKEMETLRENLEAAEGAAVDFVDRVSVRAREELNAELSKQEEATWQELQKMDGSLPPLEEVKKQ